MGEPYRFKYNYFTDDFDMVDGFLPYEYIPAGAVIEIPLYRQMNVMDELTVDGELSISGTLNLIV